MIPGQHSTAKKGTVINTHNDNILCLLLASAFGSIDMASTARTDEEKVELFDSPEVLKKKVDLLAQWIRDSKHCIAFTVREIYC